MKERRGCCLLFDSFSVFSFSGGSNAKTFASSSIVGDVDVVCSFRLPPFFMCLCLDEDREILFFLSMDKGRDGLELVVDN